MDWLYLFFSFDGRVNREPFWIAFLIVFGLELAFHFLIYPLEDSQRLSAIVSLAFAYPEFAVLAKRGHDRNISPFVVGCFFLLDTVIGLLIVLGFGGSRDEPSAALLTLGIPWYLFALVLLIELGFRRGTVGPNRYGPDPLT